jgi:hypothetical protein
MSDGFTLPDILAAIGYRREPEPLWRCAECGFAPPASATREDAVWLADGHLRSTRHSMLGPVT